MSDTTWPDALRAAEGAEVSQLLHDFWRRLALLPELAGRQEHLLCAACTGELRQIVLRMMLALNGITYPAQTRHLNRYLGASQQAAIEKTLIVPFVGVESWIGQAVALVVIYRWYAPQLAAAFGVPLADALEGETLARLRSTLPDWPETITTD
jgi:hypothetical protein